MRFLYEILVNCHRFVQQIMNKLQIKIDELYNLLKFIRHKINLSSLELNDQNIIDILSNVYMNNYLKNKNDCKLYYFVKYFYFTCLYFLK